MTASLVENGTRFAANPRLHRRHSGNRMGGIRNQPGQVAVFLRGAIDTIPMMVGAAPFGIVFGALAVSGERARSPAAWGLDCAMTVTFIGIVVPLIKNRPMLACALAAALISLATKGLPNRLGYLIGGLARNTAGMLAEAIQRD